MLQIAYAFPLIINIFISSLSGHVVTGVVWFTPAFLDTCCFAVKFFGLNGLVVFISLLSILAVLTILTLNFKQNTY